ncbi:hypothetical protein JABBAWOKKIE_33 [Mycobacterium phage Jabbawokkie]|uniref:DUF7393 domain-containing protein n=1 Tax=Mycobacterium phage Zapner TaxID=1486474 RepID=A0A059VB05_9CAUD|nr:hypothetical protein N850_gp032 [Mycobacterium phage Jabbawokkie]YP_009963949.1 hypothetical protein I5I04_gp032 [Mycobacterium phage Zapner]UCR74404.1 hypothetical protein Saroj_28 [Mycobacterium phage Saroj]UZV39554.1 HNH endonuclease [Mycobacterium phage Ritam007]AGT12132.1 hypothetical protein JABBAWOKKIE_33 [Mycobacterium phage Jabbawokkie]AHZ95486.1 hypothetical protein PBI_ZAPNER_32 [Mycobacterium phage Zapner]
MKIHVQSRGPAGWNATVLFTAGTVYTVADDQGRKHLIDTSRVAIRRLS